MGTVAHLVSQVDEMDFAAYVAATETQQRTVRVGAYEDDVVRYFSESEAPTGGALPWSKAHGKVRLRPGEVSVWAGINGHGKSALLGQVLVSLLAQGERACVASMEMRPVASTARMVRQMTAGPRPTEAAARSCVQWLNDHGLWIYDQQGTVQWQTMIKLANYCADRLRVRHLVIDSLMKCVRAEDDFNGQKEFVDALCDVARHRDLHIHLVHHIRKGDNEQKVPGKFDLKGSGSVSDQVDNVFIVWRRTGERDQNDDKPDALVDCVKQRHGDWTGKIALWCHDASLQFVANSNRMPMNVMAAP